MVAELGKIRMACGQSNRLNETVRRRLGFVLFVFSAWIIVLMSRLADFMIFSRDSLIATAPELQVKQILKKARRGTIKLESGKPLAWSVMKYQLLWKKSESLEDIESQRRELVEMGIKIELSPIDEALILHESFKMGDMINFIALTQKFSWLDKSMVFLRRTSGDLSVIGEVVDSHGISGFEKEFDEKLCGSDGLYETVHNSRGKVMPDRSTVIKSLRNGDDVIVSLEEKVDEK